MSLDIDNPHKSITKYSVLKSKDPKDDLDKKKSGLGIIPNIMSESLLLIDTARDSKLQF